MKRVLSVLVLLVCTFYGGYCSEPIKNFDQYLIDGNNSYRNNDFPRAIANYEMALIIRPSNEKLRNNLRLANDKNEIFEENIESNLLIFRKSIVGVLNPKIWFLLFAMFSLTSIGLIYIIWVQKNTKNKTKAILTGTILLMLFTLCCHQYRTKDLYNNPFYLALEEKKLFQGADERSEESFTLRPGIKVKKIDQIGEWIKVQAGYTDEGWIKEEGLFPLNLAH